ncbi:hypothetical protein Tco_0111229 [Tanacetum coccineum]
MRYNPGLEKWILLKCRDQYGSSPHKGVKNKDGNNGNERNGRKIHQYNIRQMDSLEGIQSNSRRQNIKHMNSLVLFHMEIFPTTSIVRLASYGLNLKAKRSYSGGEYVTSPSANLLNIKITPIGRRKLIISIDQR